MGLQNILSTESKVIAIEAAQGTDFRQVKQRVDITEKRIRDSLPYLKKYIAFWREYPDIFAEFLCGDNPKNFRLYFYQRVTRESPRKKEFKIGENLYSAAF